MSAAPLENFVAILLLRLGLLPLLLLRPLLLTSSSFSSYRVLFAGYIPAHRGASLTAKICLHGDPAWLQATAPARQWASSLWRSLTTPTSSPSSFREHIRVWLSLEALNTDSDLEPEKWNTSNKDVDIGFS
ncbi:unnamed protein product [Prorocentrum cordatum]|uniref:Mannosyltransferase n=1 Tax=Prorocentrum cordatum TaxID=2364126 RepID=A0ABN9PXG1_9DINO|nr:unnamed protein product [Polarella glacialis]